MGKFRSTANGLYFLLWFIIIICRYINPSSSSFWNKNEATVNLQIECGRHYFELNLFILQQSNIDRMEAYRFLYVVKIFFFPWLCVYVGNTFKIFKTDGKTELKFFFKSYVASFQFVNMLYNVLTSCLIILKWSK